MWRLFVWWREGEMWLGFVLSLYFFVSPPLVTAPPPSENLWRKKKTQEVISCILSVKSCWNTENKRVTNSNSVRCWTDFVSLSSSNIITCSDLLQIQSAAGYKLTMVKHNETLTLDFSPAASDPCYQDKNHWGWSRCVKPGLLDFDLTVRVRVGPKQQNKSTITKYIM